MRILQTISSMGINNGGPSTCTLNLVKGLKINGVDADVLTFDINTPNDKLIFEDSFMKIVKPSLYPRYGYSKEFRLWLIANAIYDLYHANALWQYSSHATIKYAFKNEKPIILSPHGMLYPEGLKKSKWIKKLSFLLYQQEDLNRVTAFHATSIQELRYIRDFGLDQPIALIPNAIDPEALGSPNFSIKKGKKKIGFMGRLVPIKNLEILLKAWAKACSGTDDAELVLIGDAQDEYKSSLIRLAEELKITNISFIGFVTGTQKLTVLEGLNYLILPSKSENFGMVVTEALFKGIPVIASKGTPWEELNTYNCGWWVDADINSLSGTIIRAITLAENDRIEMGKRGNQLVLDKYSVNAVGGMMKMFYLWLIKGGEKPTFVDLKKQI